MLFTVVGIYQMPGDASFISFIAKISRFIELLLKGLLFPSPFHDAVQHGTAVKRVSQVSHLSLKMQFRVYDASS